MALHRSVATANSAQHGLWACGSRSAAEELTCCVVYGSFCVSVSVSVRASVCVRVVMRGGQKQNEGGGIRIPENAGIAGVSATSVRPTMKHKYIHTYIHTYIHAHIHASYIHTNLVAELFEYYSRRRSSSCVRGYVCCCR